MTKTASRWRSLLREQERSGLTVREFAARRGLAASTLSWWRWRLRRREEVEVHGAALVPVALIAGGPKETEGTFEVVLGSGAVVRVPHGFDAAELSRLVQALGSTC